MFTIRITHHTAPLTACIDGCPDDGIAAVDFRRAAGLPDAPSCMIDLKPGTPVSEEVARILPLDGHADFNAVYGFRQKFRDGNDLKTRCPSNGGRENHPRISAAAILAWQTEQTAEHALGLYRSVQEIGAREELAWNAERQRQAEEKAAEESAKAQARELLAGELDKLQARVEYLEGELQEAREKIAELESVEA